MINTLFLKGIRLLKSLRERDATELAFGTTEEKDGASDPVPEGLIQGRDLLNAARDGYVYRASGKGHVTLLKRHKDLVLKVRPAFVHSAEMAEVARIFHLKPGLPVYKIESELTDEVKQHRDEASQALSEPEENETIYMNLRSVLQIMTFLSKGVCIPDEHVTAGIAPITLDDSGQAFDWTQVTAGHFVVHAQKHRPHDAEVAVSYRGYWFYIATDDVQSRAMLAILEVMFALQESGEKTAGPVLTLPVGG